MHEAGPSAVLELAARLSKRNGAVDRRWQLAVAAGEVSPDLPYVALGTLATLIADEPPTDHLAPLFRDLEVEIEAAPPPMRKLIVVGLIEDLQTTLLNHGLSLNEWEPLLGPQTLKMWLLVEGLWAGTTSPAAFNAEIDPPS